MTLDSIILFDIDYTLFDTMVLRKRSREKICRVFKIEKSEFDRIEAEYVATLSYKNDFEPKDFIKTVGENSGIDYGELFQTYADRETFREAIYPDVIDALTKLQKEYRLGVYSEGFEDFQTSKLRLGGIENFFDNGLRFIFRRKLSEESINKLPRPVTIVDDSVEVMEFLKSHKDIKPIFIERPKTTLYEVVENDNR